MPASVEVKEWPILFSAPMVRAILDGRKSQTRRVVKPQPEFEMAWASKGFDRQVATVLDKWGTEIAVHPCPYGQPGDRLWVRETWAKERHRIIHTFKGEAPSRMEGDVFYRATTPDIYGLAWRPSIHMPRWASRILLEIVDVRVERLQQISEEDAIAEGYESRAAFLAGDWAKKHSKNPWVWVVEFKRV